LHLTEERIRRTMPLGLRRSVFGLLGQVYPKADWAPRYLRAKTTLESLSRHSVGAYFSTMSIFRDEMRRQLFSSAFKSKLGDYNAVEVFNRHAASAQTDDPLALIQYLDLKTYLVGDINTKVDRASMAHSLEVREPLLDHPLVEWLGTLPSSLKVRDGQLKWMLKRAMHDRLPAEVLYRPKMGFAVPLARWLRGPLRERVSELLEGDRLLGTGIFDARYLRQLQESHQSGARDYSAPIWSLLMFDAFLRNVVDGSASAPPMVKAA